MADTTNVATTKISDLSTTNSPASSDDFIIDTAYGTRIINYSDLADAILSKITSKAFTINGSTQSLTSAIGSLMTTVSGLSSKVNGGATDNIANVSHVGWGTSVSLKGNGEQFLVMRDIAHMYIVWFSGSSNSSSIQAKSFPSGNESSGSGSINLDSLTFSRSGSTLTVSSSTSACITIIG